MHVNVRYNKIVIITQLCVAYNKNVILSHVTVLSVFEDLDQIFFFWTNQVRARSILLFNLTLIGQ